ncbi:MAG: hypothetical protein ACXWLF_01905 [Myxococcaceae bacterium]
MILGRLVLGSAVLGTVLVLACAHAGFVPQPTVADVDRVQPIEPGLTLAEMQQGRAFYVQRCSSCHPVHGPGEYRGDQWPGLVEKMKREKKIRIPEHEQVLMERYLVAFSSTAPKLTDAGMNVVVPTIEGSSSAAATR